MSSEPGRGAAGNDDRPDVQTDERDPDRPMTLAEYQRAASRTINASLTTDQRLVDAAAGLAEEAGEALGIVRKHVFMHHELDRARLTTELGDALWCLTVVAGAAGVSLEDIATANLAKLRRRYPDGYSHAASVERSDRPER